MADSERPRGTGRRLLSLLSRTSCDRGALEALEAADSALATHHFPAPSGRSLAPLLVCILTLCPTQYRADLESSAFCSLSRFEPVCDADVFDAPTVPPQLDLYRGLQHCRLLQ